MSLVERVDVENNDHVNRYKFVNELTNTVCVKKWMERVYDTKEARKELLQAAKTWKCADMFEKNMSYSDAVKTANIDRVYETEKERSGMDSDKGVSGLKDVNENGGSTSDRRSGRKERKQRSDSGRKYNSSSDNQSESRHKKKLKKFKITKQRVMNDPQNNSSDDGQNKWHAPNSVNRLMI